MTLQEFFETEADKEIIYYIGSSSSFFFIGNMKSYKKDINEISAKFKKNAESLLDRAEFYLGSLEHKMPDFIELVQNIATDDEDYIKKLNSYIVTLRNIEPKIHKSINTIKNQKKYLEKFTPLQTREIIEVYPRVQNDGVVIKIAGGEEGRFWFKEEYDSKIVNEPDEEE